MASGKKGRNGGFLRNKMGLKKVMIVTVLASAAEWAIYLACQGRYGIEVHPALYSVTIPFMVMTNFITANIAQKIFTGKIDWRMN